MVQGFGFLTSPIRLSLCSKAVSLPIWDTNGSRWMMPVRPGDVLHVEGEVAELIPSRTKPQGIAKVKWTAYNQRGEAVYTFTPIAVLARRPDPVTA
jgi:acyl dehydratase